MRNLFTPIQFVWTTILHAACILSVFIVAIVAVAPRTDSVADFFTVFALVSPLTGLLASRYLNGRALFIVLAQLSFATVYPEAVGVVCGSAVGLVFGVMYLRQYPRWVVHLRTNSQTQVAELMSDAIIVLVCSLFVSNPLVILSLMASQQVSRSFTVAWVQSSIQRYVLAALLPGLFGALLAIMGLTVPSAAPWLLHAGVMLMALQVALTVPTWRLALPDRS